MPVLLHQVRDLQVENFVESIQLQRHLHGQAAVEVDSEQGMKFLNLIKLWPGEVGFKVIQYDC